MLYKILLPIVLGCSMGFGCATLISTPTEIGLLQNTTNIVVLDARLICYIHNFQARHSKFHIKVFRKKNIVLNKKPIMFICERMLSIKFNRKRISL
jgi:hypothetical protein